ncbi:hypothetical protein, partial [Clostridium beijerinckii]|uniref:hypothetical protein n=1 Tax=Clostridium beijerinckii TaxID=1520 RepID=UPI001A9B9A97
LLFFQLRRIRMSAMPSRHGKVAAPPENKKAALDTWKTSYPKTAKLNVPYYAICFYTAKLRL